MKFFKILFLFTTLCKSQTTNINYTYDFLDKETTPVYEFWKEYVSLRAENNILYKNMWDNEDNDLVISASGFSPNFFEMYTYNKLLYIKSLPDNKFELSSMFYWIQDENNVNLISIVNYIIKKNDDKYIFENFLTHSTKNWKKKNVGLIDYYYPINYKFNKNNAKEANKTIENLNKIFDLNENKIKYYIVENCDKQLEYLGVNYIATTGLMDQCGYFDKENNILLSTFYAGENYQHEIIHLINKKFPNAHYLLLTGLSVYHKSKNANIGRSLDEVFKDFDKFIINNSNYNLSFTGKFPKINNRTSSEYIISAILIDLILEKGGVDLLKKGLITIKTDEELNNFLINELNITDQNNTIRKVSNRMKDAHYKLKIDL
ncbi:hypothetical protein [Empedobacter falsenii]|uniref:Uncharacterized protein n=1 Tax=Empedobacter falsenii TaxID=343874 RepID=A0A7H9DV82_9FLAO|nr:hypothetical protein [Empedobacter falsenii]QLL59102.1 hypothetical protein FH779_13840 [Empedobacter falsenii]